MNTNYHKTLASSMTDKLLKIRKKNLRRSFQDFTATEHRMEYVGEINKVVFVNDAKAQTINATYFALKTVQKPVIWIAGGADRNTPYEELLPLVRLKVEALIMLGEDNTKLFETFVDHVDKIYQAKNMEEAIYIAKRISDKGSTILYSPGSKPDALFSSIEDRGNQFKKQVRNII
jgi:UDP-N-acetylmuramoylalanine--D-glutamate ligase